jgi:hypothetical protein
MATFKIDKDRVRKGDKSYTIRLSVSKNVYLPFSQLGEIKHGNMIVQTSVGEQLHECYIFNLKEWIFNKMEHDLKKLNDKYKLIFR